MAYLVAVNPEILSYPGGTAPAKQQMLAADAKTWVAGQLGYVEKSGGTVTPITTSGVAASEAAIYVQFLDTQSVATSTSTVWVRVLPKGTELAIFVQTNGTETVIAQANVGTAYGLENISSVTYLDLGTASGSFLVKKLCSTWNPTVNQRHTLNGGTGEAGRCIVELI